MDAFVYGFVIGACVSLPISWEGATGRGLIGLIGMVAACIYFMWRGLGGHDKAKYDEVK